MGRLIKSPFGLALNASRQSRQRIEAVGFDFHKLQLTAFILSGAITGLAGALFADLNRFVSPSMFSWQLSGEFIVFIIIGGVGRLFGPVIGALIFVWLEHLIGGISDYWHIFLGFILLAIVLFGKGGIIGLLCQEDAQMNKPILEANKLCKTFGSLVAVQDVSIDIHKDEIHAVIGPNGAGKSTLISQICGSLSSDKGSVFLLGKDITNLPTEKRASLGIGRTFQISALAKEDTVLENAILGSVGASGKHWRFFNPVLKNSILRDEAEYCLELVGLKDLINLKTATLSHGQLRLLEVAIALTLKPKVFIMDEPMAGLGSDGTKQLTEFLDKLRERAPILLVEHDMDAVFALANRITVLDYGRVIASDKASSIKKDPEVQKAYLGEG